MYKSPGLLHYHNSPIIQDKLLAQARRATAVNTKQTEELKQTVKIQQKTRHKAGNNHGIRLCHSRLINEICTNRSRTFIESKDIDGTLPVK